MIKLYIQKHEPKYNTNSNTKEDEINKFKTGEKLIEKTKKII